MDTLTPLDARNSLLLDRSKLATADSAASFSVANVGVQEKQNILPVSRDNSPERYLGAEPERGRTVSAGDNRAVYRSLTPTPPNDENLSSENLLRTSRLPGSQDMRQPTLPNVGGYNESPYGGGGGYRPAQPSYGQQQQGGYNQGRGYNNYNGQFRGPPSRGGY